MINVLATIQLKPGMREEFLAIFNDNVPAVLAEDGCVEYFPAVDAEANLDIQETDENAVTVIEKWQSVEALHAHLQAPHMNAYKEKVAGMVVGVTLKVLKSAL